MRLLRDNKAATAIEYGLLAAMIAIAALGAVRWVGGSLRNIFWQVGETMQNKVG